MGRGRSTKSLPSFASSFSNDDVCGGWTDGIGGKKIYVSTLNIYYKLLLIISTFLRTHLSYQVHLSNAERYVSLVVRFSFFQSIFQVVNVEEECRSSEALDHQWSVRSGINDSVEVFFFAL